jgi:hypothetical protein
MPAETDRLDSTIDSFATGLYSLASMLVGPGEDGVRLVETAFAGVEAPATGDAAEPRQSTRRALAAAGIEILENREPGCLAAPDHLEPVLTCIEDEDLDAAGAYGEELERMIAGPDRDRVRDWLESLPPVLRTIFVLRAVAGFSAQETATLLAGHAGPHAAGWTAAAVREVFRQGLCSLASQLLHETAVH